MCGIGGMMNYRLAVLRKGEIVAYIDRLTFWEKYMSNISPKKSPTVHVVSKEEKYKSLSFHDNKLAEALVNYINKIYKYNVIVVVDLDEKM